MIVVRARAFPDHYPLSKTEIENLTAEAKRDASTLVTREKDLARLRGSEGVEDIMPFPVTLEFDELAGLRKFVSERLFQAREKKFRKKRSEYAGQGHRPQPQLSAAPSARPGEAPDARAWRRRRLA